MEVTHPSFPVTLEVPDDRIEEWVAAGWIASEATEVEDPETTEEPDPEVKNARLQ